jgi:hypothetical protein
VRAWHALAGAADAWANCNKITSIARTELLFTHSKERKTRRTARTASRL